MDDIIQVDIPIKYLSFFLEDDAELEHIKKVIFLSFLLYYFYIYLKKDLF